MLCHGAVDEGVEKGQRYSGVLALKIVEVGPEKVSRPLGFRRHELAVSVLLGPSDVSGLSALSGGGEQGFHGEDAGYDHCRDIAPIHLDAFIANHFLVEWRRIAIE